VPNPAAPDGDEDEEKDDEDDGDDGLCRATVADSWSEADEGERAETDVATVASGWPAATENVV
jgi:hypothetical protein